MAFLLYTLTQAALCEKTFKGSIRFLAYFDINNIHKLLTDSKNNLKILRFAVKSRLM